MRLLCPWLFAVLLLLARSCPVLAHDIPSDATVHAFVKPGGERLQLLVRVPLRTIRDVDFPATEQGYLDIGKLEPQLVDAATLWISGFVDMYESERLLPKPRVMATRISFESDRSFTSFEEALGHVTGPTLSADANVVWNQALFDVLFEYPIGSDRSRFSIRPGFEQLAARVVTVLRFVAPGGAVRAYELRGDPGVVSLDPRWHQAALRFLSLGFFHILDGIDHLLFLLCLVIPFRRFRALIAVITAFTLAHSVSLIASAFNMAPDALWFPPLIEALIAVSIVWMGLENIVGGTGIRHRWKMAFAFGLVHGFGFSFALRETLQFAGSHLLASLLSFNVGVELGQLLVILLLVPALEAVFRFVVAERIGTIIISAFIIHTGWHWTIERVESLRQFSFEWPALTAARLADLTLWLMVVAVIAAVAGAGWRLARRRAGRDNPARIA